MAADESMRVTLDASTSILLLLVATVCLVQPFLILSIISTQTAEVARIIELYIEVLKTSKWHRVTCNIRSCLSFLRWAVNQNVKQGTQIASTMPLADALHHRSRVAM